MKHALKVLMFRFALMSFLLSLTMLALWVGSRAASPHPTGEKPSVKTPGANTKKSDVTPARVSALGKSPLAKARNSSLVRAQILALAMLPRATAPSHIGVAARASASAKLPGAPASQAIVTPAPYVVFLPSDPPADD